jgi:hypothetical protein
MQQNWVENLPEVVWFIIGIGGVAGAILAIIKLWQSVVPDAGTTIQKDISSIKGDIHEMRKRVGMLEMDVAKIDQPSMIRRFDAFEQKLDRLYDLLIERLTKRE